MTTVGRLADYARKASIQISVAPPMTVPIMDVQPREYKRSEFFIARDQREAGIEHHEWERTPPLRSWGNMATIIILGVGVLVLLSMIGREVLAVTHG